MTDTLAAFERPSTRPTVAAFNPPRDTLFAFVALGVGEKCSKAAKPNAITFGTLCRAKISLGILSIRQSARGHWYWKLPDDPRDPPKVLPHDASVAELISFLENDEFLGQIPALAAETHNFLGQKSPKPKTKTGRGAP
jgi:hypothetical protein